MPCAAGLSLVTKVLINKLLIDIKLNINVIKVVRKEVKTIYDSFEKYTLHGTENICRNVEQ